MTAMAAPVSRPVKGQAKPRLAPPTPVRSDLAGFRDTAETLGIHLMPWQETAARYLEAQGPAGKHLYREVAVIVARQNGKSTLLVPLIVKRLLEGRRIMHTAQNRKLPFEVFEQVAEVMWDNHRGLFPMRNGRPTRPRYANGQEEIRLTNDAIYSIVAPTRGGARGPSRDLVIIDELREMDSWDFIAAAKPTLTASPDPQMVYLSNAGAVDSVVLNAIRNRRDTDESLAYLEWSASPERLPDDRKGWAEANPAMGHEAEAMGKLEDALEIDHRTAVLEGTLAIYETEHLCRWVDTMRETLVAIAGWDSCEVESLESPVRPFMGISMDPSGKRAAMSVAWQRPDGTIGSRLLFDVTGSPIDTDKLGKDLRDSARKAGAFLVGFDPLTDAMLAKFFPKTEPISAGKWANASARFVELVEGGPDKLAWTDSPGVGTDLAWTARKPHDESGSFQAVRADDNRPIPAALATIRAVWLASQPRPVAAPTVATAMGF